MSNRQNMANFSLLGRNPDVLSCIANLSSDEVFTPPELAKKMLDLVEEAWRKDNKGKSIWSDKNVRILDPFTKSGVFLREATARFTQGLESEFPDLQQRVDHILANQIFGIGITALTSLLSRRSLYCSKFADSQHSITSIFQNDQGNIWFDRVEHEWIGATNFVVTADSKGNSVNKGTNGKCRYCGAPQLIFDRDVSLETHAYAFIHTDDIGLQLNKIFGGNMQFDVVIGNPPYQMTDAAGGGVDSSIYHLFVNMAKKLEPRYLSMVIPSRWMGGATRGVGDFNGFRERMLSDGHIRNLVDFPNSKEVFPGVDVKGGVCYFLWDSSHQGDASVITIRDGNEAKAFRKLNEHDVFVRDHMAIQILHKVKMKNELSIINLLTADTPFGIASNFNQFRATKKKGDISLYYSRNGKRDIGFIERSSISKNAALIDKWKVLTPGAGSDGGQKIPDIVLGKPWISTPPAVCTQTFLAFFVDSEKEAESLESYYRTKFFRFLVSLRKITQNGFRSTYEFVPQQKWNQEWSDEKLFKKYELTKEETEYINMMIRPMSNLVDANDD
jgi:site-specific DNA-methyltransferase (adenine-specific)